MKRHAAELITRDPERFFHHDRVFLNNPVVMQGMGLAPLVVLATSGQNAVMLAVAVALLLVPSRMLACLLSRLVPLHDEDPRGREYFWLTGAFVNEEPEAQDTDEWALSHGYVSVVPVQVDLTDYRQLGALAEVLK